MAEVSPATAPGDTELARKIAEAEIDVIRVRRSERPCVGRTVRVQLSKQDPTGFLMAQSR
jgi:hypothetical protein